MKGQGVGLISIQRPKWKEMHVIRRKENDSILGEFEHMEIKYNMEVAMDLNRTHFSNSLLSLFIMMKIRVPINYIFQAKKKPPAGMYLKKSRVELSI